MFKVEKEYVEHAKQELPELSQTKKELEDKLKEYNKWNLKYWNKSLFTHTSDVADKPNNLNYGDKVDEGL